MRTVDPRRHAARRAQILTGAAEAFAQKGYDNTTVKDICTAAGVGSGTMFHYFADKRAIFHGVLQADRDEMLTDITTLDTTKPRTAFWALIDRMTADLRDPTAGAMMLAILGQLAVDPEVGTILGETDAAVHTQLTDLITRLQANGDADPGWEPTHAATWVRTIIDGLYLRCSEAGFDPDAELSRLHTVLARAVMIPARGTRD
jgi:AcrR family transcriptional regulator